MRRRWLWTACALVGLAELAVASLVLHPNVDPVYRAYFIDRSSDCWPHQTPASYVPGTTLSFVYGRGTPFDANKICGWFYPNAHGAWSYGRFSLLRFNFAPVDRPLRLTLAAGAMVSAAHPGQRVAISINGTRLGTLLFDTPEAVVKTLDIPAGLAASGRLDLRFDYPDARSGRELGPNEDPHLRALRMVALTLAPVP